MNTSARRLTTLLVALVLPALALVLVPGAAQAKTWPVPQPDLSVDALTHPSEYANRVMLKINKLRAKRGLRKVKAYQSCLDHKANTWAAHLADIGKLVHRDQKKVLAACNLSWTGETLVSGTALLPGAAVRAWMHSPPHKAVIMKPRAKLAGVGMSVTPLGVVYCVLNFGDPA